MRLEAVVRTFVLVVAAHVAANLDLRLDGRGIQRFIRQGHVRGVRLVVRGRVLGVPGPVARGGVPPAGGAGSAGRARTPARGGAAAAAGPCAVRPAGVCAQRSPLPLLLVVVMVVLPWGAALCCLLPQ